MSGKKGREASNTANEDEAPIDGHDLVDWDRLKRGAVTYKKQRISPENVLGRLANELPDFEFFQDMGDIKAWQVIVQECGIPSDPEQRRHMGQSDYRAAVKQRLGVEPSPADPSDIRASFGWVVAQFAGFHEILSRQRKNGDLNGAVETAKYIGRLFEWWRWRREGHDAEAVSKQKQNVALPKARQQANRDRQFIAENWHDEAKAIADRIRERRPHLSKTVVARRVLKKLQAENRDFRRSVSTIRRVI